MRLLICTNSKSGLGHNEVSGHSGGAYLPAAGFTRGLGSHLGECVEDLLERAFVTILLMFQLLHR